MVASRKQMTERKRTQEALELAAKRFELVTSATQDAVFDWDLAAHEVWRNENYQRLFGAPERSSDSDNWWVDRLHPEDRGRVVTAQELRWAARTNSFWQSTACSARMGRTQTSSNAPTSFAKPTVSLCA